MYLNKSMFTSFVCHPSFSIAYQQHKIIQRKELGTKLKRFEKNWDKIKAQQPLKTLKERLKCRRN